MRMLEYPQSCSARTLVEFGHTHVGFGGGRPTKEDFETKLDEFITKFRNGRNTFLTCLMNNDQDKFFHDVLLSRGFICVQKDMIHPKYGKRVSFYLYTEMYTSQKSQTGTGPKTTVWHPEETAEERGEAPKTGAT
jgi:hypothetical protein